MNKKMRQKGQMRQKRTSLMHQGGNHMNLLKRNQAIILVIALMLVSAGYLNFVRNQKENTIPTTAEQESNM